MIKKIKQFTVVVLAALSLLSPTLLVPALGGVASASISSNICTGAQAASGENTPSDCKSSNTDAGKGITQLAKTLTTWFSIVVGAISVIMIIYGGFRYITSGGSSEKVGAAKNTLIYAIVGLIVVALAQLIVNVVLTQAGAATTDFQ
ncbi:MAG: pilin [Patescibacteria group bacterium]